MCVCGGEGSFGHFFREKGHLWSSEAREREAVGPARLISARASMSPLFPAAAEDAMLSPAPRVTTSIPAPGWRGSPRRRVLTLGDNLSGRPRVDLETRL